MEEKHESLMQTRSHEMKVEQMHGHQIFKGGMVAISVVRKR
jgi:hypothetical protein